MNDTLKAIVHVLENGKPEIQVAAAQILGELRARDASVVRALGQALRRSPVLGRFSLDALAKIGSPEAVEVLASTMSDNEPLADHAAHLLAEVGISAHGILAESYAQALGDQRARILGVLARALTKEAVGVFVHALLTPETTDVAGRLLLASAEQFQPALQKTLRDGLAPHLEGALPEACLVQVVAVLARIDGAGARNLLVGFTEPGSPVAVRSAAFRAMRGTKLTAAQVRSMLDLLEDPAEKGVHDAVREVLGELPEVPEGLLPVLKRLLGARQPEQRLFALRMLRSAGGGEMAKVAMKFFVHEDPRFREAAADALAHNRQAVELLVRFVQTSRDPDFAEAAAAVLVRHGADLQPKALRALAEKAIQILRTNVRAGDLLLGVALSAGGAKIVAPLVERAVRLRKARRLADALHVLARVAALPEATDEVRYQLALAKLLDDMARPAAESASPGNPTMGFFAALVRSGFPLAARLRKEPSLTPDALLRVATHFVDAVGVERRFGAELLQHIAGRNKGRAGDEARVALRAVGG
ncbi:MAG: hypothetical protein JNK78_15000 [Planctomycetes bacterium]|nr:hypothetical protein [Planctomycetota bacterium]